MVFVQSAAVEMRRSLPNGGGIKVQRFEQNQEAPVNTSSNFSAVHPFVVVLPIPTDANRVTVRKVIPVYRRMSIAF